MGRIKANIAKKIWGKKGKKDKEAKNGVGLAQPNTACFTELGRAGFIHQMMLGLWVN